MTAMLSPLPVFRAFDANGAPLSGGKLYTYAAGTTTPLASYTDASGATTNTNPIVLDSSGSANVWLGFSAYKLVLQDADGNPQWIVDNVQGPIPITFSVQTVTAATAATLTGLTSGIVVNFSGSSPVLTLPDVSGSAFTPLIGVPLTLFTTGNAYDIYAHDGVTLIGSVAAGGGTLMLRDNSTSNGSWSLNAVDAAFRGALVTQSADQSPADTVVTTLTWDTVTYDTDAIYAGGSPTRLTVPASTSKIRIGAGVYWNTGAGTIRFMNIKKGGSSFAGQPQDIKFMGGVTAFVAQHVWSPPIAVVPGNYFEVVAMQTSGGVIKVLGNSAPLWFAMEILA